MKLISEKKRPVYIAVTAAVILTVAAVLYLLLRPSNLWVNGTNLLRMEDASAALRCGGGRAGYDAESGVLTLDNASVTVSYNDAAIYSDGSLQIELVGDNYIVGEGFGILAKGGVTFTGSGTLSVWGGDVGIFTSRTVTVSRESSVLTRGGTACLKAGDGLQSDELHRLYAGTGENDALPGLPWEDMQYLHIHAPVALDFAGEGELPSGCLVPWGESAPHVDDGFREGYYFDGWFTEPGCQSLFDRRQPLTADTCLYAGWTKMLFIRFDSWGGSEIDTKDIRIHTAPGTLPVPEKRDQIFAGWYADDDLIELFDPGTVLDEDITLYARWDKVCDAAVMGVDVSSWQKNVDWKAAKRDGVSFAILRAGFRGYGSTGSLNADESFSDNLDGALAAGLDVGCYFYCQSTNEAEAIEEAEYVLELIDGRPMTLPVFLDFEVPVDSDGKEIGRLAEAKLNGEQNAAICLAFCRRIEEAGYTAMVYAGKGHLSEDNMAGILEEAGYGVWLAHWRIQTTYPGRYDFWQYSAKGEVDGIKGDVDMDIRYICTPGQVTGLTAEETGEGVRLDWQRCPGVYGYIVERRDGDSGEWTELARVSGAGITSYTDAPEPTPGVGQYAYRVSAYLTAGKTDYIGAASDEAVLLTDEEVTFAPQENGGNGEKEPDGDGTDEKTPSPENTGKPGI